MEMRARVGAGSDGYSSCRDGSPSRVTLRDITVTANGGKKGTHSNGGAGYSGGGGQGGSMGGDGGSNGGDGGRGSGSGRGTGGSGTGENITRMRMSHFTLSPGRGGSRIRGGGGYGGGGGGVLVGGNGPYRSGYQGAGYGGGGSGRAYWTSSGADGVILVEVV